MSKSHRSLCVSFSRTGAGLCIYHLLAWSNLNFLHKSQWITLPTQSCLALYSFCANLLHSPILLLLLLLLFMKYIYIYIYIFIYIYIYIYIYISPKIDWCFSTLLWLLHNCQFYVSFCTHPEKCNVRIKSENRKFK